MLLARKTFTLGDTVQWTVDYREQPATDLFTIPSAFPVRDGDSITTATVVSNLVDVTVGTVTVYEGHKVVFLLSGASINEVFTLTVVVHTDNSEVFTDTILFTVVNP